MCFSCMLCALFFLFICKKNAKERGGWLPKVGWVVFSDEGKGQNKKGLGYQ